ncbi:MAG: DUF58 domain-containing protein [Caloramator sp.]|nr:DUF58 domain-containing protein [Caloramator sp.]
MFIWLFVFILLAIYINLLSKKNAFKNLFYSVKFSKEIAEIDEEFEITSIIENKKMFPITYLNISQEYPEEFKFGEGNNFKGIYKSKMSVLPFQRVKRSFKVSCLKRGRYILKNAELTCGDLLGFETMTQFYETFAEIVVIPKPYLIKKLTPYGSYTGDISVKRWIIEDPLVNIGIKEYTGREPLKQIHWPSTLRQQKIMVKEYDYTTDNNLLIALNIETCKPFWQRIDGEAIEKCISIARSLVDEFETLKIPYGLTSNAQNFLNSTLHNTGLGLSHRLKILEALGRIDYSIFCPFEDIIESKNSIKNTTIVVITPLILDEYVNPINNLIKFYQKVVLITLSHQNTEKITKQIETYFEGE